MEQVRVLVVVDGSERLSGRREDGHGRRGSRSP
jgi:hypothetical protein